MSHTNYIPGYYVADTENLVPPTTVYGDTHTDVKDENPSTDLRWESHDKSTRVWAFAVCPVALNPLTQDVSVVNTIHKGLFEVCQDLKTYVGKKRAPSVVFFHNLAYDGPLIVTELLEVGFTHHILEGREKHPPKRSFTTMISDDGAWYSIEVRFSDGGIVIFRDSLKILPFSVDSIAKSLKTTAQKLKGSIDYSEYRDEDHEITPEEDAYIRNDVLVMSEALANMESEFPGYLENITIGSGCLKSFKNLAFGEMLERMKKHNGGDVDLESVSEGEMTPNSYYKSMFSEVLTRDEDEDLRKAYRGGWCYVNRENPHIAGDAVIDLREVDTPGHVYDVNSLYPASMHNKTFPVGRPVHTHRPSFDVRTIKRPYIVHALADFTVKDKHVPFVQLKGNGRFAENEYITNSHGPQEITLTAPDVELLFEQYNVNSFEIVDVWIFGSQKGVFDSYIDQWFAVKEKATIEGNSVMRMVAKLHLNNLYGKMAQSAISRSGIPYLDGDRVLHLEESEEEERGGGYIPIGAYITAYARQTTIRAAQNNFDIFLYADTDSIHCSGPATGIEIDPNALGAWDHEGSFRVARYVRQKCYIELIESEDGSTHLDIKAGGANPLVKERLTLDVSQQLPDGEWEFDRITRDDNDNPIDAPRPVEEVISRFGPGLKEAGKLMRRAVPGGTWLVETTFTIHGRDEIVRPRWSVVR